MKTIRERVPFLQSSLYDDSRFTFSEISDKKEKALIITTFDTVMKYVLFGKNSTFPSPTTKHILMRDLKKRQSMSDLGE